MQLSQNLIPSRRKHSISEAVFTLFLAQPILKPARFKELMSKEGFFKTRFQHFKLKQTVTVSGEIKNTGAGISGGNFSTQDPQDEGFVFESFSNGEREYIIKSDNGHPFTTLSIHCLQYERWRGFIDDVSAILLDICDFQSSLFITSIGLSYVDQFNWLDDSIFPANEVFSSENKYIPTIIMSSEGDWSYSCGHKNRTKGLDIIEHVNINLRQQAHNNQLLTLSQSTAKEFNTDIIELSKSSIVEQILPEAQIMHDFNKEFLQESLSEEVLNIIGLK